MRKLALLLVIALLAACCAGCAGAPSKTEEPDAEKIDRAKPEEPEKEEAAEVLTVAEPEEAEEETFEVILNAEKPEEEPPAPDEAPAPEEPPEPDAPPAETVPEAPEESGSDLYINEFTVEDLVQDIRADYQAIVFDTNLEVIEFTTEATAFLQNGNIVHIAEYRQLDDAADPATATVRYYYRGGEPFFIHISYENHSLDEVRLYFYNGELIRRIIGDGATPIDGAFYDEWNVYFDDALSAYESVQSAR